MKKLFVVLIAAVLCSPVFAQSWDDVKRDRQNYLTGEGWGETIDEADQQALAALISKISVDVSQNFEMLEGESRMEMRKSIRNILRIR